MSEPEKPTAEAPGRSRTPVPGSNHPLMPGPEQPMYVARGLLGEHTADGVLTLRHWRGTWWAWDGPAWTEVEDAVLARGVYEALEHAVYAKPTKVGATWALWNPDTAKVGKVLDAMTKVALLEVGADAPAWLVPVAGGPPAGRLVSVGNGLLDVGTRELYGHTPRLLNTFSLPFEWDPDAPEPAAWLAFLASLWPGDAESVALLQEWFGYVLSGRTDLHKLLMLIGAPRSGKGTIARVLQALVGKGNHAGPALSDFGERFGLTECIGKPLAVIGDARVGPKTDGALAVSRLLSITGEDALTIDRKYRQAWTGTLPTRVMILSNELPRLTDSSGALAYRALVLKLTTSFLGREDHGLGARLLGELPGILRWSLAGLDRLAERGRFTVPASSADEVAAMAELTSPVGGFLAERCQAGGSVPRDQLWAAWKLWATEANFPIGTRPTFGKDLRAALPSVQEARPVVDGRRVWHYVGLSLLPPPPPTGWGAQA